jgi:diguanylate cyclase (GGDEF)-like protein
MLDLDHFKRVNDLFGHKAGDFALQAIATAWKFEIRQNDYICRYGGEEFAILLPETNLESALLAAERLRSAVMQLSLTEVSAELRLTVSIGVAVLSDPDNQTIDLVIERADLALYQSKQNGRNRVSAWENEQLDLFRAAACGYIEDDCCRQHGASHHILVGNANAH